jgi:hypothetical protein
MKEGTHKMKEGNVEGRTEEGRRRLKKEEEELKKRECCQPSMRRLVTRRWNWALVMRCCVSAMDGVDWEDGWLLLF